jgi:hypothetical protein
VHFLFPFVVHALLALLDAMVRLLSAEKESEHMDFPNDPFMLF